MPDRNQLRSCRTFSSPRFVAGWLSSQLDGCFSGLSDENSLLPFTFTLTGITDYTNEGGCKEPPVSFSRLPCSGAASACPPGKSEHAWSPADRQQKMAKLQEPGDGLGEGILVAPELDGSRLAGNRLNLDVYPDGCHQFLDLFDKQRKEVTQVEFLRLNCNEDLIISTLAILPALRTLKSLVLKGGHARDEFGACQRGSLTTLPPDFGNLMCLTHLDLSFNSFSSLPSCITHLANLSVLVVSHNCLVGLPEDFGHLTKLTDFFAIKNHLRDLPQSIGELVALKNLDLSENTLESLPEEIGNLYNCMELNLSGNRLTHVPDSLANLGSLHQLHLHSNLLVTVPASLANLPNLFRLDLQNNRLRYIPPEIQSKPFVHLRGNPLGEPEMPLTPDESSSGELQRLVLAPDENSFTVTPKGCKALLACGIRLYFPPGAATTSITIHFQTLVPDPQWVKLRHHDILLSKVLELQPHGLEFQQEVQICMPYASTQTIHEREVVVRTFSGQSWSDLGTKVEWKRKTKKHMALCSVPHFSWFLVISQLVENKCSVPREGTLLFSTVDPNIKVTFPPGVTEKPRTIRLQVLTVSPDDLKEIMGDPESRASPLLCLSQNSSLDFLRPVKVQLPLPPGVTGLDLTLDHSRVHLLHGDLQAQIWDDITDQVVLEFTHRYAIFEVTHFSWYWLWYTTKKYIGGMAKKVYERLRMYQVNFIALQRKKDPEQVLLQCVPKHKVDPVLKKLHDRYRGPEPSDMVEMFEGEQFFAAFERGINIDADRPDCMDGRLSFIFYSHLKNMKEIYVTSAMDRKDQAVKGQVSFYRGAVPENVPEDASRRRKGPDSHWLATLPIKLPKLKLHQGDPSNGFSFPPLNLGNEETGYLTQANLLSIARRIGADWQTIGLNLGLTYQQIERIGYNNREDLDRQILNMLFSWAQQNSEDQNCVEKLVTAMKESGRQDIADEIEAIIDLGRQKYRESIRRVGLDQGSSTEDSAIAMV
ncbi:p53-induced death domain-containing protein 1 isoform X1 [Alligator mississippiensis]|uniref:p53-induced death domain-containing protein 1 isoform X1 n=1 Tax=Alligator mississippiensis TaxID=8496 RepID=UPI0009071212|nr:p53-induced death domain-containing protein 1 isoform X1 [Alligator mississippiensis]